MQYRHKRYARSFVRSFLSFVFSRCGRFISRKIFPVFLCCSLLVFPFAIQSSAYTDYVFSPSSFGVTMHNQQAVQGGQVTDYSSTITTSTYTRNGIVYTRFGNSNSSMFQQGYVKECILIHIHDFAITHEYNVSFYSSTFSAIQYSTEFYLTDLNHQILKVLHYNYYDGSHSSYDNLESFNFKLDDLDLSTNSNLYLEIVFQSPSPTLYSFTWGISDVTLRDLDDDTGFFEQIIHWIKQVGNNVTSIGSNIVTGLTNLGSNISTWLTGVKDGIVNKLTEVKNGIVNKLSDVITGINNKLEAVKTSINNAIAGIQQWFIDLKDNLINGLKSLFIPSDGYFAQKKQELDTFMTNHFGAVWQAPGVVVDFLRKLVNLQPSDDFTIQVPAIQFKFDINPFDNVGAQTYTLLEAQTYSFNWVNDTSHPIHYFYVFYKGFVLIILLFALIQYLMGKFDVIVSGLPNFERD